MRMGVVVVAVVVCGCLQGAGERDAGQAAGPDAGVADACVALTCASSGAECGALMDGCGGVLECGDCPAALICGGAAPNRCGPRPCVPTTCAAAQKNCGQLSDLCGQVLDCGTCSGVESCGALEPNVCGCRPLTCADRSAACGSFPDGCGGRTSCGTCASGQACGSRTPGQCGLPEYCTSAGWCWELASGWVTSMSALGPDDLWVTGETVEHWDGLSWTPYGFPSSLRPLSVLGFGPNDAWLAGGGVARWDGFEWKAVDAGVTPVTTSFSSVHAVSPDEVWFGGTNNTVSRFNGSWTSWRVGMPASGYSTTLVHAVGPGDVWAGAHHLTSAGWVLPPPTVGSAPLAMWASGPNDLWAVRSSDVSRWNGSAWATEPAIAGAALVSGFAADDVWFADREKLWHLQGLQLGVRTLGDRVSAIVVPERARPVIGTPRGAVFRLELDAGITTLRDVLPGPVLDISWAANEGWAVGAAFLVRTDGGRWVREQLPPTSGTLTAVGAVSPSLVYVGASTPPGGGELLTWDGAGWSVEPLASAVEAIWSGSATDTWVFCASEFRHFDGTGWVSYPRGVPLEAVVDVGASGSTVHALTDGTIATWNGAAWSVEVLPRQGLRSLSVWSPTDIWAVGPNPLHFDGSTWTETPKPNGELVGVIARGPARAWLVMRSEVYLLDLATMTVTPVPTAFPAVRIERVESSKGTSRLLTQGGALIRPPP